VKIKEITQKNEWEGFLSNISEKTFLQSWNWGEFNIKNGNKIWRFGIYNNQNLVCVCFVIKIFAKRGTFLFIPHGPVMISNFTEKDRKETLKLLLDHLLIISKQENASFIRISPLFGDNTENKSIFSELKFRQAPMHSSAYEATWKLDINLPEDELLKNMRKTTRYLIKKNSENKDIQIIKSINLKDIEIYQKLNKQVSKRQKFIPFSDEFIKNEFEIFSQNNQAFFLFGKYKNEIVAGALVVVWSNIAFYHQAASLGSFSKFSIPYLLQWEAIKEAKKIGCNVYDFWGFTDPKKYPRHPWAGPTLFKMGFSGYKREYLKTQDYIVSKKYWINYIIESIRKIKRKL
jgi:lipid II:glycine glycyltransferase (peptidoglycan interpeptide bridge formation enzyme)